MLEFITGIILMVLGWRIWKASRQTQNQNLVQMEAFRKECLRLSQDAVDKSKQQIDQLDKLIYEYTQMRKNLKEEISLNRQVTEDAIAREQRAKAALVAVMKTSGCTEEQIEMVLAKIESPEA